MVLWGLFERNVIKVQLKKKGKKQQQEKNTSGRNQFTSRAIESTTKGSTVLLQKGANEVPLPEQTELTKQ